MSHRQLFCCSKSSSSPLGALTAFQAFISLLHSSESKHRIDFHPSEQLSVRQSKILRKNIFDLPLAFEAFC